MTTTKVLSIDPSYESGGIGYALMKLDEEDEISITDSGTVTSGAHSSSRFVDKVEMSMERMNEQFKDCDFSIVLIEMPETWGGYKSMMSSKTGVLHKLFFFVGVLYHWATTNRKLVTLITVSSWKGQIEKRVIKNKVIKRFGYEPKTLHESDAIGIGLYYLSKLKRERS